MIRSIVGFHTDEEGVWVADLSCHHGHHVRHDPPFQDRAWVLDPARRAERVGAPLACARCDRAELPDGLVLLVLTDVWDERALPLSSRVPEGRWGLLRVHDGEVDLRFESPDLPAAPVRLTPASDQAVPPGVAHRLLPVGRVSVQLELWGPPGVSGRTRR